MSLTGIEMLTISLCNKLKQDYVIFTQHLMCNCLLAKVYAC